MSKNPSDSIGTMINMILIEIGKALRPLDKDSGKTIAAANPRLRTTLPMAVDIFHQSLDELECEIVRAKAVLERDLEHLREKSAIEQPLMPPATSQNDLNDLFREQSIMFPDGRSQKTDFAASAKAEATRRIQDPNQPSTATPMLSPPSSDKLAGSINPAGASSLDSAATTLSTTQESLDSLLGMTAGGTEKNQVSSKDSAFPTQTQDDSQALKIMANSKELDLKDPLKPPSSGGETVATSKADALDDLLSFSNDRSGGDDLDLDLPMGMKEGEDSVFDDIFFAGEDGIGGAEELEHGQFDNAYFGIDD